MFHIEEKLSMQEITPCLWFNDQAEEAVNFYVSIFKNSKIGNIARYTEEGSKASGKPADSVMTIQFQLNGHDFLALNGGPNFTFTPAISFIAKCETQADVDHIWNKLGDGGEEWPCGWIKDKYGISWQVVPEALSKMMLDIDPARAGKVMAALHKMSKIDIAVLQAAYD
jgi:predicted 3-demethylubiquinone-9 3-methyltransferase (glyoxalase superfamily)